MHSDYYRPAHYQVNQLYRCRDCGDEQEVPSGHRAQMPCPKCRGWVERAGETYPGNHRDWDEVNVKGRWINKRDIPDF